MTTTENNTIILSPQTRRAIIRAIDKLVRGKFVNIAGVDLDEWSRNMDGITGKLLNGTVEDFQAGVRESLAGLKSSHTGLFHGVQNRFLPQHSINTTLKNCASAGKRWVFIDVFAEGPADRAGIQSGDVLLKVNGIEPATDTPPQFQMGVSHKLTLAKAATGETRDVTIDVPLRKGTKQRPPIVEPKAVTAELLPRNVGLLKIPYFSGAAGMRFGSELDVAVTGLKRQGADRLIIDLRGNIGGSLGFAILASYLCPDQRPIGYSVTPKALRRGYFKETLPKVRMPSSKLELILTMGAFALRDKSVVLMTQGLGPQPFHGKVAILINEFTHSAGEMLASFAAENHVALLVGTKTPGNVLGAANFPVGHDYYLRIPVFGWFNWSGQNLEGIGVRPDLVVGSSSGECSAMNVRQLDLAIASLDSSWPDSFQ